MQKLSNPIQTIVNNTRELNVDSESFYRDYWSDATAIENRSDQVKDEIINRFFPEGLQGKRILEVGVGGEGGLIVRFLGNNDVHGVDESDAAIRNCLRMGLSVSKVNLDCERLMFPPEHFDIIIALEVFEHFASPQFALEELKRLLKDGGILLVSTPTPWCYHWPRLFYPSLFREDNFTDFLLVNGFTASKVENWFVDIPHNRGLDIPSKMKVWNWFWKAEKIGKADAVAFYTLGAHFWNKIDQFGVRESPLEALEYFRRSFTSDGNERAWLSLTHTLLYRFLYNDTEEFMTSCTELLGKMNGIITAPVTCPYVLTYIKIVLEANRFGYKLVEDEMLLQFSELACKTPVLYRFLKDIAHEQQCIKVN